MTFLVANNEFRVWLGSFIKPQLIFPVNSLFRAAYLESSIVEKLDVFSLQVRASWANMWDVGVKYLHLVLYVWDLSSSPGSSGDFPRPR